MKTRFPYHKTINAEGKWIELWATDLWHYKCLLYLAQQGIGDLSLRG